MKTFNVIAIVALLIAFAGPISQHGKGNIVSYLSVVPLLIWVVVLIAKGATNK